MNYHFSKLNSQNGIAKIIGGTIPYIDKKLITNMMNSSGFLSQNPLIKHRFIHLKLALAPNETLSDYKFDQLSRNAMKMMGLSDLNPSLIIRHRDTPIQHVHIVVSTGNVLGKFTDLSFSKYKCLNISRTLERSFSLKSALGRNLTPEGLRSSKFLELKNEAKNNHQSSLQLVKDIVESSIKSSPTYSEMLNRLLRNNIETRFRISKRKKDGSLMVGVSYAYKENLILPEAALPLNHHNVSGDQMDNLCENGYSINSGEKIYLTSSNHLFRNSNQFPVRETKPATFRAKSIGDSVTWFGLKEKFPQIDEDKIFSKFINSNYLVKGKKDVWEVKVNDIIPSESKTQQVAMIAVTNNQFGLLQNLKVDFKALFESKEKQLKNNATSKRLQALADLQIASGSANLLKNHPVIAYRYEQAKKYFDGIEEKTAVAYAYNLIKKEVAYAMYYIDDDIQDSWDERRERLNDGYYGSDAKHKEEDLKFFYFNSANKELSKALEDDDIKFLPLRNSMDYLTLEILNIEPQLLIQIEKRISIEIAPGQSELECYQTQLNKMGNLNHKDFRFLLHMNIDFTYVDKEKLENIIDERLKFLAHSRSECDVKFLGNHIRNYQRLLNESYENKDARTIVKLLKMPMLDYSKIDYPQFKVKISKEDYNALALRVLKDQKRSENLNQLHKGNAQVDRKTGEIIIMEKKVDLTQSANDSHNISFKRNQGLSI